jgi:hypothetical protein
MSIQDMADDKKLVECYEAFKQQTSVIRDAIGGMDGAIIKLTSQPGYEKNAGEETMKRVELYRKIVATCQELLRNDTDIKSGVEPI